MPSEGQYLFEWVNGRGEWEGRMGRQNERMRGRMRGPKTRRFDNQLCGVTHNNTKARTKNSRDTATDMCPFTNTRTHTHTHTTGWARLIHHIPALRHFLGKPALDGHAALAVVPLRTLGLPRAHVFRRRVCRGREVPLVDLAPIACTFRAIPRLPPALRRRPIRAPRDAVKPGRT